MAATVFTWPQNYNNNERNRQLGAQKMQPNNTMHSRTDRSAHSIHAPDIYQQRRRALGATEASQVFIHR
jgi:hypothetical protein